ncbi:hypothetical protein QJQ45_023344, partial [Haematococcus lacustris]
VWQVVSLVNLNQFLAARGYLFFLGLMYSMVVGLLVAIILSVWVGHMFKNNRFDHVWPILVLRTYSVLFFQVLDIACLTLFLVTLDCQLYFTPQPSQFYHQEFPEVYCWSMPHIIHVCVSIAALLLFSGMAALFTMAEMESNPLSHNFLAMGHSKVELVAFGIKLLMTTASTLVYHLKWLAVMQSAAALCLLWLYLDWVPHMHTVVNNIRVATQTSILYCAVLLLFLGFLPGVDVHDPGAVRAMQDNVTVAMWAGLVPAALLGWMAGWARQRWFAHVVAPSFKGMTPDSKPAPAFNLVDARQVEILSRCCRTWIDADTLDEEAVALAETIMKIGMAQLPSNPYVILLYASFLIDVQQSYQSGYSVLQQAKKADPSFLERFAIFSREQQHTQKSAGAVPGQATDLVSYVELSRNLRLALKVHKEALMAIRMFWACLVQHKVNFDSMSTAVERMDSSIRQADKVYRSVLQRHTSNMKLVRLYAKFLESVKHDPWSAAKWFAEAEKLEQLAEEAKASNVFQDMDLRDPALRASLLALGPNSDHRAVVIINAQCLVQMINQTACEMLGYQRSELVGRNVNIIVPPPFSEFHNNYVRTYLNTSKANIINRHSRFVAMHKERHVVDTTLLVTKVSGIGEDTMFMGLLEASPPPDDVAHIWVMFNGQVVSADINYADWFGYAPQHLVGKSLSEYVVDFKRLDLVLREARASQALGPKRPPTLSPAELQHQGSGAAKLMRQASRSDTWSVHDIQWLHCFAGPVACHVTITNGGIGTHLFNMLAIRRLGRQAHSLKHMLVSDRQNRVLHITQQLSAMLGSTPKGLMASGAKSTLEALLAQPFSQLHASLGCSVPPHQPPAYSCRSGLSVLMAGVGPQGPMSLPVSLSIRKKQHGMESEQYHITSIKPCTVGQ